MAAKAIPKERHELKFIVDDDLVPAMRHYLAAYCEPDEYTRAYLNVGYPITSTYYDTPDWKAVRSTLEGDVDRMKLRVRCYVDAWSPIPAEVQSWPAFFEMKRKYNGIVMKRRALTTVQNAAELIRTQGAAEPSLPLRDKDRPVVQDFFRRVTTSGSRPAIIVRYRREAFESKYHEYVRITFDRDLCAAMPGKDGLPLTVRCRKVQVVGTIFEIKFTGTYPRWVGDLIQRFELQRRSVPKLVLCVQELNLDATIQRGRNRLADRAWA